MTFDEVRYHIMSKLAGKAGSELQFGKTDIGAEKDIDDAMDMIKTDLQLLAAHGFEYCYTESRYDERQSVEQLDKNHAKAVQLLEEYYNETKALLTKHKDLLDAIAGELIDKEILIYDDIVRIAADYPIDG